MKVVFRVDASIKMGIGHAMRCLTLADALKKDGAQCHFVCRKHPGNIIEKIASRGHQVSTLPLCQDRQGTTQVGGQLTHAHWLGGDWLTDAQQTVECVAESHCDWLVVDHYALDERWEKKLRPVCNEIMVIDDLADRKHDCDLLLDQTYGRSQQDYEPLAPNSSILVGAKYALLQPEFAALRNDSLTRRKEPKLEHLLISLGGIDKDNITGKVLKALKESVLPANCRISVVMGKNAPWLENVKSIVLTLPWATEVMVNVENMAQLMAGSDLAIGAAGSTSWERCCLGVPTLMIVLAENQKVIAGALHNKGAALTLGSFSDQHLSEYIEDALAELANDVNSMKKMTTAAFKITEGRGSQLVTDMLCQGK